MFLSHCEDTVVLLGFVQRSLWLLEYESRAHERTPRERLACYQLLLTMVKDLLRMCLAFSSVNFQASYGRKMR